MTFDEYVRWYAARLVDLAGPLPTETAARWRKILERNRLAVAAQTRSDATHARNDKQLVRRALAKQREGLHLTREEVAVLASRPEGGAR